MADLNIAKKKNFVKKNRLILAYLRIHTLPAIRES